MCFNVMILLFCDKLILLSGVEHTMESSVRARVLQGFGELVTDLGADPGFILKRAGLEADALERSDQWIPFRSAVIAYELAAAATKCGSFGIQLAGRRDLSYLGPMVLIFRYSRNLEQGLLSCIKYMRAHNTGYIPELDIGQRTASWRLKMDDRLRAHADQWTEESLLTSIKFVQIFLGENYFPQTVLCRHARVEGTDYERLFGTDLKFHQPFDGIVFAREDLSSPNPTDDQQVYRFLLEYLDSRVLRADEDLSAAARSLMFKLIPTGKFSVNVLADQLHLHRRTFQRRLKTAGLTYAELLDDCRAQMARDYLLTSNLPMGNLAYLLGYSDQSAFNHAFRRWYGMTPRQWSEQPLEWRKSRRR